MEIGRNALHIIYDHSTIVSGVYESMLIGNHWLLRPVFNDDVLNNKQLSMDWTIVLREVGKRG